MDDLDRLAEILWTSRKRALGDTDDASFANVSPRLRKQYGSFAGEVAQRLTWDLEKALLRGQLAERLAELEAEAERDATPAEVGDVCAACGASIVHNPLLSQWEHRGSGEAACDIDKQPDGPYADPTCDADEQAKDQGPAQQREMDRLRAEHAAEVRKLRQANVELRERAAGYTEQIAALEAQLQQLLADVARLEDEGVEAMGDRLLEEFRIRSMDFRNGLEMDLQPAREIAATWVAAARALLGDAPNYASVSMDIGTGAQDDRPPQRYTLTVQRTGKLSPHEARQHAEAEAEQLRNELRLVARHRDRLLDFLQKRDKELAGRQEHSARLKKKVANLTSELAKAKRALRTATESR